jgi:hypothetical protein
MKNINTREIYESPEMELVVFEAEDVITTSSIISGSGSADDNSTDIIVW